MRERSDGEVVEVDGGGGGGNGRDVRAGGAGVKRCGDGEDGNAE